MLFKTSEILFRFTEVEKSHVARLQPEIDGTPGLAFENRFSKLTVEHPESEDFHHTLDEREYDLETNQMAMVIIQDEQGIEEDFIFAVSTFFREVQMTRDYLKDVWAEYNAQRIELIMASILSDTAFHLVRKAEQQLESLVTRPNKYPAVDFPVSSFPGILLWEKFRYVGLIALSQRYVIQVCI